MIRDPSDGTVKESNRHGESPLSRSEQSDRELSAPTSGLPITKPDERIRLEASRDWLKGYFHRKTEVSNDAG